MGFGLLATSLVFVNLFDLTLGYLYYRRYYYGFGFGLGFFVLILVIVLIFYCFEWACFQGRGYLHRQAVVYQTPPPECGVPPPGGYPYPPPDPYPPPPPGAYPPGAYPPPPQGAYPPPSPHRP